MKKDEKIEALGKVLDEHLDKLYESAWENGVSQYREGMLFILDEYRPDFGDDNVYNKIVEMIDSCYMASLIFLGKTIEKKGDM